MDAALAFIAQAFPWAAGFALVYSAIRYIYLRKREPEPNIRHEIAMMLFFTFVFVLFVQTMVPFRFTLTKPASYYNFVPFNTITVMAGGETGFQSFYFVINILGNILVFAPVGFLYRLAFDKGVWKAVLFGALMSLTVEAVQVILPRTTDIDDIIMNTLGTLIGALLYSLIDGKKNRLRRYRRNVKSQE